VIGKRLCRNAAPAASLSIVLVLGAVLASGQELVAARDLGDLSLEQLSNIVVTSVSGRAEPISGSLTSIYVITNDDIRRSGANSVMEALRLAPNLEVAQSGADGYAITARGFIDTLANKLLVLIDGRNIYTPTFSGVFWDAQDVMLEDVDRIEVISGPGGVLWGANAVNGVINIITKSSVETQGGLVAVGGGNREQRVSARYGGATESGHWRGYAQGTRRENTELPDGTGNLDGTGRVQGGTRWDLGSGRDAFTVQGDAYDQRDNQEQPLTSELRGVNVLGRWTRTLGEGEQVRVLAYWDHTERRQQKLDTGYVDFGHLLRPHGRHRLIWGGGLRQDRDRIESTAAFAFIPADKDLNSWNVYAQDEIALRRDLDLTVGAKVDRNSYTGEEFLPSVRLGWRFVPDHLVWAAWSRALRTPSRFDKELFIPGAPPFLVNGGPDFESEISYVYELGYRGQMSERFSWAATLWYDDLDKQRSLAPGPAGATVENDLDGHSQGIEVWGAWRVVDRWRLSAGYNHLEVVLAPVDGAIDLQPSTNDNSDPNEWAKLRSALDLGGGWQVDVMARYYGALDERAVPSYTAVDGRVGWSRGNDLELSLLLRNLTDSGHIEWAPLAAEFDRTWFLNALVRF
jgi:iron complex outermembrane receptor protein